jgi:hypothetical protein
MWCTIQGIFILCVVCVMTTISIGTNIITQDIINMSNFKMVLDNDKMIKFLQQDVTIIIVVGSITNLSDKFSVWKGKKWENIFSTFLNYTIRINVHGILHVFYFDYS